MIEELRAKCTCKRKCRIDTIVKTKMAPSSRRLSPLSVPQRQARRLMLTLEARESTGTVMSGAIYGGRSQTDDGLTATVGSRTNRRSAVLQGITSPKA